MATLQRSLLDAQIDGLAQQVRPAAAVGAAAAGEAAAGEAAAGASAVPAAAEVELEIAQIGELVSDIDARLGEL